MARTCRSCRDSASSARLRSATVETMWASWPSSLSSSGVNRPGGSGETFMARGDPSPPTRVVTASICPAAAAPASSATWRAPKMARAPSVNACRASSREAAVLAAGSSRPCSAGAGSSPSPRPSAVAGPSRRVRCPGCPPPSRRHRPADARGIRTRVRPTPSRTRPLRRRARAGAPRGAGSRGRPSGSTRRGVVPVSWFGRRFRASRPVPWASVMRSSRSVVQSIAGSWSSRSFCRASLSQSDSSASRRSVTSSMVPT